LFFFFGSSEAAREPSTTNAHARRMTPAVRLVRVDIFPPFFLPYVREKWRTELHGHAPSSVVDFGRYLLEIFLPRRQQYGAGCRPLSMKCRMRR